MTFFRMQLSLLIAACGLAGCGSSSGSVVATAQPGVNGLDYGFAGQELTQTEGLAVTARAAEFTQDAGSSIEDVTVTLEEGFIDAAASGQDAVVTVFGEEVTITGGEGVLDNGQTIRIFFDADQAGTYSGAISLVSYGSLQSAGIIDPIDGEAQFVFGFETSPSDLASLNATTGSAQYSGDFIASGIVQNADGDLIGDTGTEFEGSIIVAADFVNNVANSTITGSYDTTAETVTLTLTHSDTAFDASGFTSSLDCADCTANASDLEATFYGPNAEELGGVASLEVTSDVDGESLTYLGVGHFILTP